MIDVQPPPVMPVTPPRSPENRPGPDARLATPVTPHGGSNTLAPPTTDKKYTVVPGDTLTSIANTHCPGKGGVKAILEANKEVLSNPNKLRPGMTLKIPALAAQTPEAAVNNKKTSAETTAGGAPAVKTEGGSEYVVQSGDTLERIARKLFNDGRKWRELFEWNREQLSDPARLRAGQVLKVKQASGHAAAEPAATDVQVAEHHAPEPKSDKPASPKQPETAVSPRLAGPAADGSAANRAAETEVMSANSPASLP
ncbi:MAG: LysM peptidoglycan-binding domain-containing protein [Planctomycetota bacterium]